MFFKSNFINRKNCIIYNNTQIFFNQNLYFTFTGIEIDGTETWSSYSSLDEAKKSIDLDLKLQAQFWEEEKKYYK